MTFDKAAYWREKNARKIAGKAAAPAATSTRIVCLRCKGSSGQLIKETFFCANGCDPNSYWNRVVGYFGFGNWRVIYLDGERSIPMTRRVAEFCRDRAGGGLLLRTQKPVTLFVEIFECGDDACKEKKHLRGHNGERL